MKCTYPALAALACVLGSCADPPATTPPPPLSEVVPLSGRDWLQMGRDATHQGGAGVVGQNLGQILAALPLDSNVEARKAEVGGNLLIHYQAPLAVSGREVLLAIHSGAWSGAANWGSLSRSVLMLRWRDGTLATAWNASSDWKPVPAGGDVGLWEPVFHAAIHGNFAFVPSASGGVDKLRRADGVRVASIRPFGAGRADVYVAGPLTADSSGNLYYNAIELNAADPWGSDVRGAWLVRIDSDDRTTMVSYAELVPGAPAAGAACSTSFADTELPWPPSPAAVPPTVACGGQRPGINVAPAVGRDGTVYTVSRAHRSPRHGYLVAVNPNLSPRWAASLRDRLSDGCGSAILPVGGPSGCRAGATPGVDPATNEPPAGLVVDRSSSSPVVAPDGSVLYGAYTRYNGARGHLFLFGSGGDFRASYDYGWDTTPAVWEHEGGWSVVTKDNHYGIGSYCSSATHCPTPSEGPYDITQLDSQLRPQWRARSRNTEGCTRLPDGSMSCSGGHVNGFEWCINAPAVDANGVVYANSEDGFLYAIAQGGDISERILLDSWLGAAYTPLAIDTEGRIYTQNNGKLFVVGR